MRTGCRFQTGCGMSTVTHDGTPRMRIVRMINENDEEKIDAAETAIELEIDRRRERTVCECGKRLSSFDRDGGLPCEDCRRRAFYGNGNVTNAGLNTMTKGKRRIVVLSGHSPISDQIRSNQIISYHITE